MAQQNLVLIPGLLCTERLFSPQIAALRDNADISVADHGGHDTMPELAASILAEAPDQFALAGLSMGGYIAFEILCQAPERVTRVALLDTNARADLPGQQADRQKLVELAMSDGLEAVYEIFAPLMVHPDRLHDDDLMGTIRQMVFDTGVDAYVRQQKAIMSRPDNRPGMSRIDCPTLIVVGKEDQPTPVKVAREMADGIPESRLEIIADCGHLTTLERPGIVNGFLSEWLG